jgi:hypothetical protein
MKGLPRFQRRSQTFAQAYASRVLTNEQQAQVSSLHRLVQYEDGHYRAIFRPDYFVLTEGHDVPTKSQWNTLKKRMKRIERNVFVFKEHGETPCGEPGAPPCYYVDFGFIAPDEQRDERSGGRSRRGE